MVRLHLVGFTTDLKNLIFATRKGAKRGGYILEIDRRLLGALDEVANLQTGVETRSTEDSPRPAAVPPRPAVKASSLSPKQIQNLLREGKSEEQVAKLANTDVSWIRRFTAPIIAERAGVIDSVRAGMIAKPRLGPSSETVGQAIQQNLLDKRVQIDPETFENSWKAIRRSGRWQVVFQYSSRGKRRLARFAYDPESREVKAVNEVALEVGWRSSNSRKPRSAAATRKGAAKNAPGVRRSAAKAKPRSKAAPPKVKGASSTRSRGTRAR